MKTSFDRRWRLSPMVLALLAAASVSAQTQTPTAPAAEGATPTLEQVNIRDTYEREDLPTLAPGRKAARPRAARAWAFWVPRRS